MMKKQKKLSKVKKTKKTKDYITIKSADWQESIELNESFDDSGDVMLEACTRILEQNIKQKEKHTVGPVMEVVLHKSNKMKMCVYNTYKVLINASMHKHADVLRTIFIKNHKIDLNEEPLKSKSSHLWTKKTKKN